MLAAKHLRMELLQTKGELERELLTWVLDCRRCNRRVHWVEGAGPEPGHWAHGDRQRGLPRHRLNENRMIGRTLGSASHRRSRWKEVSIEPETGRPRSKGPICWVKGARTQIASLSRAVR